MTSSPLNLWRIADKRHPLMSGVGAAQIGGRWNSPGYPVIYTGTTYAVCLLEMLAHTAIGSIPQNHVWIKIEVSSEISNEKAPREDLPSWNGENYIYTRAYGDKWIQEQRSAILIVPSVVGYPHEQNALLNPAHPHFSLLKVSDPEPVIWDERLFR